MNPRTSAHPQWRDAAREDIRDKFDAPRIVHFAVRIRAVAIRAASFR